MGKDELKNTRLNEILSSLSKDEFMRLAEFLQSPYLNKNKQVILFYYFLAAKKSHPDYSQVLRGDIFDYIYKDQKFNLDKYLKASSDFVKAIERFLIYELRNGKDFINKRTLLEIAGNRNLPKTFSKYLNEINVRLKSEFNKDLDYYLAEYESKIESMLYNVNAKDFNLEEALIDINGSVNTMICYSKLELMIKLCHISNKKNKIWFDREINEYIASNLNYFKKYHPMIYLKNLILKMFINSDANIYKQIKAFIASNEKKISKENLSYLFDKLLTFCSLSESDENKTEEFEIIKSLERNSLLATDCKGLDYMYFLKIINASLSENDAYWAEKFLKDYEEKLDDDFRENTVNLARTCISIYKHKYKEALQYVSMTTLQNDYFYLNTKTMLLIIFYELEDLSAVNYTVDSFGVYFKRNKREIDYSSYQNFLRFYKQLLSLKCGKVKAQNKNNLIKDISSEKNLINKEWLLSRL